MATFYVENFGCRATQADGAAVERDLLDRGWRRSASAAQADVIVVNTCTVTAEADRQARQAIRKLAKENANCRIYVTGCYAQRAPEELARLPGVAWVIGNSYKREIPRLVAEDCLPRLWRGLPPDVPIERIGRNSDLSLEHGPAKILTGNILSGGEFLAAPVFGGELDRTRPTLKIQDGCNLRCAYCVIPFVRGNSRSLAPDIVLAEIRKLTAGGFKEVVLSGINLGSYGQDLDPKVELIALLRRILAETDLERLRLSSVEPLDVTPALVALVAQEPRMARHFHVPLQSGSDRVLRRMHRWYKMADYARRIESICEWIPDAGIGADVMAGFPGETEEDHRTTLGWIERLPFTYLHVFGYSPRPGTAAFDMPDKVPAALIKRRNAELRALAAEKAARFRASQVSREMTVLTLHRQEEGVTPAISDNYLRVSIPGNLPANQWTRVRATVLIGRGIAAVPA
jgi:threonylcarbamoyladenosine tRNA methylthiotransferase MtaB